LEDFEDEAMEEHGVLTYPFEVPVHDAIGVEIVETFGGLSEL
jgi:hypothetical protein